MVKLPPVVMESHHHTTMTTSSQYVAYSYEKSGVINEWQLELFEIVNVVVLSTVISLSGIVANIINIIVFFKQGFTNTVNISLFAMAISDLCCLLSLLWICVWFNPFMNNSAVPVYTIEFQYLTGACLHVFGGRITSYITVYVTAERCLCIFFPLKIKQLVTPTRTTTVVCCIYVINILTVVPEYATSYLDWKFFPEKNKSLLAIAYTSGREESMAAVYFLFLVTGILSFVSLIVFTVTLAVKLQQSSQWRKKATAGSGQQGSTASKEKKTIKMIVVIATVLIVCYTPGAVLSMTTLIESQFYLRGKFYRLCTALWSIAFVFDAFNSSINICLYYSMSSNYRITFRGMFSAQDKDDKCTKRLQTPTCAMETSGKQS